MIVVKDISKTYGEVTAVKKVDLDIPSGCIYGIIGRSGAGKSSLLRVMSLLETPDKGEVYYNGQRVDILRGMALLER
ncbi:ATP-binding cassette domain-containing protein, partial [Treponema sp. R6D11]